MNVEPQSQKIEPNSEMIDEKEELSQGVPLYVDLTNNEEKQTIVPIEIMEEEIPLQNPKECEKNQNFENENIIFFN